MLFNILRILIPLMAFGFGAVARSGELSSAVTAYSLPNGLKVLLYPDSEATDLTVNIVYKTGSKHEGPGEYGMAHLLEHMLFKSAHFESRASRCNASTNADRTSYYETLPATPGTLEFALAVEADRMSRATFTDAAIRSEMSVVKNEWEQGENSGFGPLLKEMLQIAYPHHAYGRDTLGIVEGLLQEKPETLRRFYARRYAPNLAILAIGGSFAKDEAQRLIEKYFAPIAAVSGEDPAAEAELPPQASEKQVIMHDGANSGYIGVMYRAMQGSDPEFVAAQALVHALGSGSQSVLQRELVRKGLAREAFGFVQQNAGEGFIAFFAKPTAGQDPVQLAQTMAGLLEKAAVKPVSVTDLNRFIQENDQGWSAMLRDPSALAMQLAEYEILGNWRLLSTEQSAGSRLRVTDLQAAGRWLARSNRTIGVQGNRPSAALRPAAHGQTPAPALNSKQPGLRMFKRPQ